MEEKRYVKRIVKREPEYQIRQKFNAKIGPTQTYEQIKALVILAVKEHEFESISAFMNEAACEKLVRLGYDVPTMSEFIKTGAEAETA